MTNQTIPKRSEVPEEMTWNLKDMFASDEAWMTEYEAMKAFPAKIAAFQGTLARSAGDLLAWFRLQDEIELRLSVLMGYASCKGDEDTGNSFYQDVRGKAMNVYVSIASAAAFATPEIMAIPEEALNGFYAQEPELETYRRSLYQIRRRKDHILSPAEERLLASAGEMANASENIAGVFRNADQIFPDVTDSQGSVHPLTDATFVPLLTSPDRELRRRAFETYYKQLGQYKNTIAATLDGQFKQLCFFANARHYDSTIQASLDATEVPVPVYMNLIEAVHNNLDKMYRYVALRKKLLGVEPVQRLIGNGHDLRRCEGGGAGDGHIYVHGLAADILIEAVAGILVALAAGVAHEHAEPQLDLVLQPEPGQQILGAAGQSALKGGNFGGEFLHGLVFRHPRLVAFKHILQVPGHLLRNLAALGNALIGHRITPP